MKALILTFIAAAALIAGSIETRTFTGVITDSMCKLDHTHMNAGPAADCTKTCVKTSNGKYKYVLADGKTIYRLSDQETPEKFAGQKVKVTGQLYEKTGIIKVDSIAAAR